MSQDNLVGPVLVSGRDTDAILAALKHCNGELTVVDRGAYVRVTAPGRCILLAEAVTEALGSNFILPGDLEKVMCSFIGKLSVNEKQAVWESGI